MENIPDTLLSVIVPIYNTEKFLCRCINSIINQSYKQLEIILVNDGSTDSSIEIIDDYCRKDSRCLCVDIGTSVGVGNARNIGLEKATGEYVAFVDSDDWLDSNYYAELVSAIEKDITDISVGGVKTDYGTIKSSQVRYSYKYHNIIDNRFALSILTNQCSQDVFISPMVTNKVYRTSFLRNVGIKFDPSKRAQDNYFSFLILVYAKKISLVPNTYYHYYQRNGSATHSFSLQYIDDWADVLLSIKEELILNNLYQMYEQNYVAFFDRCLTSILKILFSSINDIELQRQYLKHIALRCSGLVDLDTLLNYLDTERIRRIFCI